MRNNIREKLIRELLSEGLNEFEVPGNGGTSIFDVKQMNAGKLALTANKPNKNGGKPESYFSKEQIDVLSDNCPDAVHKVSKRFMLIIDIDELNDPQSKTIHNLQTIANVVSSFGTFGKITPDELINGIKQIANVSVSKDTATTILKDEMGEWENIIKNFDEETLAKIQSMHVPIPIGAISYNLSEKNLELIDIQNRKRVAAGFPKATYILSPQEWEEEFNRKVNINNCYPICYWVPLTGAGKNGRSLNSLVPHTIGLTRDAANKQFYDNIKTMEAFGYRLYPYYDITDTYVKDGFDDLWNSPKREGVIDNLFLVPTDFSRSLFDGDDEYANERDEILKNMDKEDDVYALAVYKALHILLGIGHTDIPQNEDGTPDMNTIKTRILPLLLNYMETLEATQKYAKKDNEVRLQLMDFAAHMFILRHRIDNASVIKSFNRIKTNGTLQDALYQNASASRELYLILSNNIRAYFASHDSGRDIPTGKRANLEALNYKNARKQLPKEALGAFPDNTGKVLNPNAIYNHIYSKHNQGVANESYMPNGTYEQTLLDGMDEVNGQSGNIQAEEEMDDIFDFLKLSDVDTELMYAHSTNMKQPQVINESSDNWFSDDMENSEDTEMFDDDDMLLSHDTTNYLYHCCMPQDADNIMANGFHINNDDSNIYGPGVYFVTSLEQAKKLANSYGKAIVVAEVIIDDMIDYIDTKTDEDIAIARSGDAVKPIRVIYLEDNNRSSLYESQRQNAYNSFYNMFNRINK